jgi:hypothetical protein
MSTEPENALRILLKTTMDTEAAAFPKHNLAKLSALAIILLLTACKSRPQPAPNLRARIAAASASRKCHPPDQCFNPSILAAENGYFITTFSGAKPQHAQLRVEALRDYLLGLPMSAWPRGPSVEITPTDDVTDGHAVQRNLEEAQHICHSLGLDVEIRPGG